MADTELKKAINTSDSQAHESAPAGKKTTDLLNNYGGFMAVKSFIPAAQDLNPARMAAKNIFLTDQRFKGKRKDLANELRMWLEILNEDKANAVEYANVCKERENELHQQLSQNVTIALDATKVLETSYRNLNAFFKNANTDTVNNLRLVNANRAEWDDSDSDLSKQVETLLKDGFDRLDLRDSYSLLVIPGGVITDKVSLLTWAKIAYKYKVMLVTDHADEFTFDDLRDNTERLKGSDAELQNVIMTANWIVGRESEKLSDLERDEKAFYMPPSGALAGKLYDESANMAQGAGGKKYGSLTDVKGVKLDLLKSEIAALMDNQVVPMVYSDGRVMAFNNSTLYSGDNTAMSEYPIVRVFDWVKKVLMNYVHDVALQNWDPYNSPDQLKQNIQDFLNNYQGYGNLFQKYEIGEPYQDPNTKRVMVDLNLTPYYAAKNFVIKLSADKKEKSCDME